MDDQQNQQPMPDPNTPAAPVQDDTNTPAAPAMEPEAPTEAPVSEPQPGGDTGMGTPASSEEPASENSGTV